MVIGQGQEKRFSFITIRHFFFPKVTLRCGNMGCQALQYADHPGILHLMKLPTSLCQWQGTCFYWKLYHLHHYFGRSSISLKANIGAKSSGVRAFTSHVWGLVFYVTAQSVPHLSVQGPTLQMKYLDSLELLYRGLESLQELFCWMRETMTQCPPIFEAETMFQYVELTTNSSP